MKSRNIGETTFICVAMLGLPVAIVGALWWHGWLLAAAAVAGDPEAESLPDRVSRAAKQMKDRKLRAVK